jgi:hypothetical protein
VAVVQYSSRETFYAVVTGGATLYKWSGPFQHLETDRNPAPATTTASRAVSIVRSIATIKQNRNPHRLQGIIEWPVLRALFGRKAIVLGSLSNLGAEYRRLWNIMSG